MSIRRYSAFVLTVVATLIATSAYGQSPVTYVGSFSAPSGFDYDGKGLTFHPGNRSLFFASNDRIAEISIPSSGTASFRQSLRQFGGSLSSLGPDGGGGYKIGGMLVYRNRLYVSGFIYYDSSHSQTRSHWSRSLNLSDGSATGPARVGSMNAGFYSGYMAEVPAEHRAALGGPAVTGNCCLSIISRTSFGPALFAFNPESMGSAVPLVYYDEAHQTLARYSDRSQPNPQFNGTTKITGVVIPNGGDSVYFFGSTGTSTACYGSGSQCNDPSNPYQGDHAYPYRVYVWAYRVADLARVRSGQMKPWDVKPYYVGEVPGIGNVTYDFGTGGAAYDPVTQRVYLAERNGASNGANPQIHVLQLNLASAPPSEPAPSTPPPTEPAPTEPEPTEPEPTTPSAAAAPQVSASATRCSFTLNATPPDSRSGWTAEFRRGSTRLGTDWSAPYSRSYSIDAGTYSFSVRWTRSGATIDTPAVTRGCD